MFPRIALLTENSKNLDVVCTSPDDSIQAGCSQWILVIADLIVFTASFNTEAQIRSEKARVWYCFQISSLLVCANQDQQIQSNKLQANMERDF